MNRGNLLLDSQRRWLFETLREAGFEPHDFKLADQGAWRGDGGGRSASLRYKGDPRYYFEVMQSRPGEWSVECAPGPESSMFKPPQYGEWDQLVVPAFGGWLTWLHREAAASGDPWSELRGASVLMSGDPQSGPSGSEPFTDAERQTISSQLRALESYFAEHPAVTEAQLAVIVARIGEADRAAGYLRRDEWRVLFLGTLFTFMIEVLVPPAVVRGALEIAVRGIGQLFGNVGELPGLGR